MISMILFYFIFIFIIKLKVAGKFKEVELKLIQFLSTKCFHISEVLDNLYCNFLV